MANPREVPIGHGTAARLASSFLIPAIMLGCGEGATDATAPNEHSTITHLELLTNPVVDVNRNNSVTLPVEVSDSRGRPVDPVDAELVWASRRPDVAAVTPDGVVHGGPGLGDVWVVVRIPDGLSDSVRVWVQPAAGEPSPFRITLLYAQDVPKRWRDALDYASQRWEQVVRADLPEVVLDSDGGDCPTPGSEPPSPPLTGTERGVRVYVGLSGGFPPGTYVEAVGGPCLQRPLPHPTTILGVVTLNRDKPVEEIPGPRLLYVAVHELGHALGLVGVIQGFPPPWFDPETGAYRGPLAIEGYRRDQDESTSPSQLEVDAGNHWAFPGDVMSQGGGTEIRRVSVGALMDLGYPAGWYGAGPF